MKTMRNLTAAMLVLSSAVLAACGHATPGTSTAAGIRQASLPTAMVHGQARKFGYDMARAKATRGQRHTTHFATRGPLPATVDNRQYCSPVADQGNLGSCTAFSMGKGLREYIANKNGEKAAPVSALWLYYYERAHMGAQYIKEDSGAMMADGEYVLTHDGDADQSTWAYSIAKFAVKPPKAADATAAAHKLQASQDLTNFDDVKAALAAGQPVAFGFTVYESFQNIGDDGVMPMPASGEGVLGGHAVLAVGYDDTKKLLTVRNSWGSGWGDKGYFYMPYDFASHMTGDNDNTSEWWTSAK
ncbi:MAG: peptidase [Cyanobacteria bacterium RYN_339]|nr:peptidase [Cyanobacteria bacterium RYN_339]